MYDSLKPWVNVPITIKPFAGRSATGEKLFGESHDELCYPKGEITIVRNWQGTEIISHNNLFVDGTVQVTKLDNVIFEGEDLPVQAISVFYKDGKPDIKVVYI